MICKVKAKKVNNSLLFYKLSKHIIHIQLFLHIFDEYINVLIT